MRGARMGSVGEAWLTRMRADEGVGLAVDQSQRRTSANVAAKAATKAIVYRKGWYKATSCSQPAVLTTERRPRAHV